MDSYIEVQENTGEQVFLEKEDEIRKELNFYIAAEISRIQREGADIGKKWSITIDFSKQTSRFHTELQDEYMKKLDILVETQKRSQNNVKIKPQELTDEVFVIMQIKNSQLDKIWKDVYISVITSVSLVPMRVDKHNEGKLLNSEIADFINRAKIVIADLTNERPNCYLEVGYTMGIKKFKNLVLTSREDHNPDSPNYDRKGPKVHFDLSGYDIIWWDEDKLEDFRIELTKKIKYRLSKLQ